VLAGRIEFMSAGTPALLPHIKSGALRCIAVGTTQRIPVLPDVPTVAELGYKDFETVQWYGITVRNGTPVEIINKLQQECAKTMKSPEVIKRNEAESAIPGGGTQPSLPENRHAGRLWLNEPKLNQVNFIWFSPPTTDITQHVHAAS
jgi:tripartite-type tricarboxylate transporter receptor subunit TctC